MGGRYLVLSIFSIYVINASGQDCIHDLVHLYDYNDGSRSTSCNPAAPAFFEIPVALHVRPDVTESIAYPTDIDLLLLIDKVNEILAPEIGGELITHNFKLVPIRNPLNCSSISFRPSEKITNIDISTPSEAILKSVNRLDYKKVLNIYFYRTINAVNGVTQGLGVTYNASDPLLPDLDGIVISKQSVDGMALTLAHEFGHYLGLEHVWGTRESTNVNNHDNNNCHSESEGCFKGDLVEDTPTCRNNNFFDINEQLIIKPYNCDYVADPLLEWGDYGPFFCQNGDPYPCNNLMRQGSGKWKELTPGQRGRMQYHLVNFRPNLGNYSNSCLECEENCEYCVYGTPQNPPPSEAADLCSQCSPLHKLFKQTNISGNVQINQASLVKNIINILQNGTLTINADVYFTNDSYINIKAGGTLIVNGLGHLTACSSVWPGVTNNGTMSINGGGTISKAKWGVYSSGPSGGWLDCDGANFIDNQVGLVFFSGGGTFANSTFIGGTIGAYMYKLAATDFDNCHFSFQSYRGISATNTPLFIFNNCTFEGAENGIGLTGVSPNVVFADIGNNNSIPNLFRNNQRGVTSSNANVVYQNNNFDNNTWGLYHSGQNVFQTSRNSFSNNDYAEGIYNAGTATNSSFKNTYTSDVGIFPWQKNDRYTFLTNCFTSKYWDVNVATGSQISTSQGSLQGAASNCFTQNINQDFICQSPTTVQYYVPDPSLNAAKCMYPVTSGNYTTPLANIFNAECGQANQVVVSEYDYLSKMKCDSLQLNRAIDSLKLIVKQIKIKPLPLSNVDKWKLSRTDRHLVYALNQWAWCLRNKGKFNRLKAWYQDWAKLYPEETYAKIKAAEVTSLLGNRTLAYTMLDSISMVDNSKTNIVEAIKLSISLIDDAHDNSFTLEGFTNLQDAIKAAYPLTTSQLSLLRSVAATDDPDSAYGRSLLSFITGENIEPIVPMPITPRSRQALNVDLQSRSITIYPNPAQNSCSIDIVNKNIEAKYTFKIADLMGKLAESKEINSTNEIDLSKLADGIYIIQIMIDNNPIHVQKLVIQKL